MKIDIAILTPNEVEFNAVKQQLSDLKEHRIEQGLYYKGNFMAQMGQLSVVIQQTNKLTNNMAVATERIVQVFNPQFIFLVGTGGGVKDVKIGDVVVATKIYAYESVKETAKGTHSRPEVSKFNPKSLEIARSIIQQNEWGKRTIYGNTFYKVYEGAIASGDKLIATNKSPINIFLEGHYNDTIAVDMEAAGFAEALARHETIKTLCIRGISNLLVNKIKSERNESQYLAAENAVAFVFELLYQLKKEDIKSNLTLQKKNISENTNTTQINIKSTGKDTIIIGKNVGNITLNKR